MTYILDEPVASDRLSVSQPKLKGNTNQSNNSFGINHYAFSDGTANNGKHKVIQTPDQVTDPATSANEPVIYAKSVFTSPKVLQFSKLGGIGAGFNGSPLTTFNVAGSVPNGAATADLIDVAGAADNTMLRVAIRITGAGLYNFNEFIFSYNGTTFQSQASPAPSNATVPVKIYDGGGAVGVYLTASGSILRIQNMSLFNPVAYYATISFIRIL